MYQYKISNPLIFQGFPILNSSFIYFVLSHPLNLTHPETPLPFFYHPPLLISHHLLFVMHTLMTNNTHNTFSTIGSLNVF